MLRSLVGSEMCIRDSVHHLHHPHKTIHSKPLPNPRRIRSHHPKVALPRLVPRDRRLHGHATEEGELRQRVLLKQSGHCLLYTSDAADEEDSVDLGGRRIIKKKKKEIDELWKRCRVTMITR
eukprot:TRINITY_DN47361_c0_g1_i1.p1 TRINITY_DN47361_c0_g1~~TRINITY_DN47361_c0_g1_i1.p1  ORF type:complete len:122 (+),score=30.09 TRINITY_DN47361_c0_g1_i1:114-479(+)